MEASRQHVAGTEGVRQLQAAESLSAPVRDRETQRLHAEMELAQSLRAGTKEARLPQAVRETRLCRLDARTVGRSRLDGGILAAPGRD